ncbi:MAG: AI-2E family transporter [Pseudomonadota bacterium]
MNARLHPAAPGGFYVFVTAVVIAVVLWAAREVFLPLALAILIAFMLSPLVAILRRRGLPRFLSVFLPVGAAFLTIGAILLVVVLQLGQIAQNLPSFQANIVEKIDALKNTGPDEGVASRVSRLVTIIDERIQGMLPESQGEEALAVRIVGRTGATGAIENVLLPLLAPVATAGLVVVVVVFMLLEREQVRDRFIRIVGANDLALTTRMLEDAAERVSRYLLTQLLVNVIYAVPIGVGLWLIGVPSPLLWGMITLVFRFVPYVGSFLSAAFPLFMAFVASPGWADVLLTAALFGVVEFVTSNFIEPQLYGSRTGLSPLAVIVSAIFWTFLWGPVGLVVSTPLTVCLVVLGRYVPQFAVFDILFGDEAVLKPHAQIYQRLLAGDRIEALSRAEEELEENGLLHFVRRIALPALLLAQRDRERRTLDLEKERRLAGDAAALVREVAALAAEGVGAEPAAPSDGAPAGEAGEMESGSGPGSVSGSGIRVACIGGRWPTDEVSALALSFALRSAGFDAEPIETGDLVPVELSRYGEGDVIVLSFLDSHPSRASLLRLRRIRRVAPKARLGVVIWAMPADLRDDPDEPDPFRPDPVKLEEARALGADFVCTSLGDVLEETARPPSEDRAAALGGAGRRC